jgi:hypothetical protein|tara:strand:- start:162 stop:788 length:627 start_codon:yes stop_codon:yes gene_type:complete
MKKLLGILVLGLLLSGCSNQKETSIENCADYSFINYRVGILVISFIDTTDPSLVQYNNALDLAKKELDDEYNYKNTAKKSQKIFANKYFKKITESTQTISREYIDPPNYEGDNRNSEKYKYFYTPILAEEKEIADKLDSIEKNIKELKVRISDIKKIIRRNRLADGTNYFKNLKFEDKVSNEKYYKFLQNCEKEHDATPSSFILKWEK